MSVTSCVNIKFAMLSKWIYEREPSRNVSFVHHQQEQIALYSGSTLIGCPPKECEIFVRHIPTCVEKAELMHMFDKFEKIHTCHLIKGSQFSHAFIRFFEYDSVPRAILQWNAYEIRKGQRITVCRSVENCKLMLHGIPKYMTCENIFNLLIQYTEGLSSVYTYKVPGEYSNSGFAELEFESEILAWKAKRNLATVIHSFWNGLTKVDWYIPALQWDENLDNAYGSEYSES